MPASVWILIPSYRDGPYQLLRMGWVASIVHDDDGDVVVRDTRNDRYFPVRGRKGVPADFGLQLLQALDRARRAAEEANSDRVVAARRNEDGWSWETYAPDEVPPAQEEPPEPTTTPPADWQPPPPLQAPVDGPHGSFVPNPQGGMPLWVPKDRAQPEVDAVTE